MFDTEYLKLPWKRILYTKREWACIYLKKVFRYWDRPSNNLVPRALFPGFEKRPGDEIDRPTIFIYRKN